MLDENRVKSMIRLAAYENGEGGQDLNVHKYSLRDYLVKNLIRTLLTTTVGYALLLMLIVFGNMQTLMTALTGVDMAALIIWLLIGYAAVLFIYLTIELRRSMERYKQACRSVRAYAAELKKLEKMSGRKRL